MAMSDEEAATLAADMARLAARPYAEVGVPMFLLAEDLRADRPRHGGEPELAATLRAMADALPAAPNVAEVARLVEVLADRHLLGADGPCFTRLGDGA